MDQRTEFVMLAALDGANVSALCKRFGISRQTGYLWLRRVKAGEAVKDRCRCPHSSPRRTSDDLERSVLDIRDEHPAWGARKIARRMQDLGMEPPSASTVHAILCRHGRIVTQANESMAQGRFEREAPNLLWQMDFKGCTQMSGAKDRAQAAEEKARQSEADRDAKSKPYLADALFVYLWNAGYGTPAYCRGPLARLGDGYVARVVNYEPARQNISR